MAELVSAMPTAGGIFYWAFALGKPVHGWLTGWLNLVGLVAVIGGVVGIAKLYSTLKDIDPNKILENLKTGFNDLVDWFKDIPNKLSQLTLGDIENGINGVIDKLAVELKAQGKIVKIGRGLME